MGIDRLSGNELPTLANWDMRRPGTWTKPNYRLAVIVIAYPNQPVNEKIDRGMGSRVFQHRNLQWQEALPVSRFMVA